MKKKKKKKNGNGDDDDDDDDDDVNESGNPFKQYNNMYLKVLKEGI